MNGIATSSIEEGLDFALNLIVDATARAGGRDSDLAPSLLRQLSGFISLRYAGELRLALEYLEGLLEALPTDIECKRQSHTPVIAA